MRMGWWRCRRLSRWREPATRPGGGNRISADRELAIQQIVSRAVVSTEIVDIMKAAGLQSPDMIIIASEMIP
jgi:type I restriction enzyme R subunit